MDPTSVPAVEAERQQREARRRGRPASQRITAPTLTSHTREVAAKIQGPMSSATPREVVAAILASPLGRHGARSIDGQLRNVRAHRDAYRTPLAVAA